MYAPNNRKIRGMCKVCNLRRNNKNTYICVRACVCVCGKQTRICIFIYLFIYDVVHCCAGDLQTPYESILCTCSEPWRKKHLML